VSPKIFHQNKRIFFKKNPKVLCECKISQKELSKIYKISLKKELFKGTKIYNFFSSVPSSFRMELVPVQFLKKGTSSRNFHSLNEFLT